MSGVLMLPEASTASSKSRPVRATSCGGPNHCGRAAAQTSNAQTANANQRRHDATGAAPAAASRPSSAYGRRKAAPALSRAGDNRRAASHGSGSNKNNQGQANSSMRGSGSQRVARESPCQRNEAISVVVGARAKRRVDQNPADAAAEIRAAAARVQIFEPALAGEGRGMRIAQGKPAQEVRERGSETCRIMPVRLDAGIEFAQDGAFVPATLAQFVQFIQ